MNENNIDCKEEYKPQLYLKFNNTELNDKECKLLIVNKFGGQVLEKERQTLRFLNEGLYSNNIIAEQEVELTYQKGKIISGLSHVKESITFHAGTIEKDGYVCTDGGRVLAISSYGQNMNEALETSYRNALLIGFEGMYFRKDLGFDL